MIQFCTVSDSDGGDDMGIPTEPIGSIPRPGSLIDAIAAFAAGEISPVELRHEEQDAIQDTIRRFESTGSPVLTGGEHAKPTFATYPTPGLTQLTHEGMSIPFS